MHDYPDHNDAEEPDYIEVRIAISYIRWSSPTQRLGDSKRRQLSNTEAFCHEHGLVLDQRLFDEKSAFKGKHVQDGTDLARLLKQVQDGTIAKGSVIIVESLDRLGREIITIALQRFLAILECGVDIVTLIDRQWYSKKSVGAEVAPLLISIISMMRAHDEVKHRADRLGEVWKNKRQIAVKSGAPMTSICPGWLLLAADRKSYNEIADRVHLVKLIFWLFNRGWSKQRIARLLNKSDVPTWGVGGKAANGWHQSYIQKIIHNRAVLGEFVPHTTRGSTADPADYRRVQAAAAIKGYYPVIIEEAAFHKAQLRKTGPRGPIGKRVANLFQGILKDGDNPTYTMGYKDHGDEAGKWKYVISDYRRVHPESPIFSWNYNDLETVVINCLTDMDWSELTVSKDAEVKQLRDDLAVAEGKLLVLDGEAAQLVQVVKAAPTVKEAVDELKKIEVDRVTLRKTVGTLKSGLRAKQSFAGEESGRQIKALAASTGADKRFKLRDALRGMVTKIELFRVVPTWFIDGLKLPANPQGVVLRDLFQGRCLRIMFSNGQERWLADRKGDGKGVRLDGTKLPPRKHLDVNRDALTGGHVIQDERKTTTLPPVAKAEWLAEGGKEKKGPRWGRKGRGNGNGR